ncbi:family 2 glycosyl transferase [Leptothermofonsia sichuanensis E412]|uniref:family 2 glycosyl transferase n=1 Tax=Leptothermofonsia sichuanensis TaxID=2917832 RepID=UPI001CA62394|nr:family 2 glycosyl transferase [Leptothermofonsia sichuanensis]QZZ20116.1 family 2 glycosyl transferase [Leptothermofonsia sichuanensis E412]
MVWQICIRYPNGQERVLRDCRNREVALKYIDVIYSQGYPMHVAYIVRQAKTPDSYASATGIKELQPA